MSANKAKVACIHITQDKIVEWTLESKTVIIDANDAKSGLADNAFCFDGINWQPSQEYTYFASAGSILSTKTVRVMDAAGNTTSRIINVYADATKPTFSDNGNTTWVIRTHNDDALSGDGRIINIDEVQDWINNKYLPALQAAGRELPDSVIKVSGPAYIMMYNGTIDGPKTKVERTNLEYYTKPGSNAANAYAGWGPNTKDDFIKLRYVSLIIPLQQNGRITINCYDEESGELLFTTTKIPEQKYIARGQTLLAKPKKGRFSRGSAKLSAHLVEGPSSTAPR